MEISLQPITHCESFKFKNALVAAGMIDSTVDLSSRHNENQIQEIHTLEYNKYGTKII